MKITKETGVSDILQVYSDIADVMKLFGVKREARYSVRNPVYPPSHPAS